MITATFADFWDEFPWSRHHEIITPTDLSEKANSQSLIDRTLRWFKKLPFTEMDRIIEVFTKILEGMKKIRCSQLSKEIKETEDRLDELKKHLG